MMNELETKKTDATIEEKDVIEVGLSLFKIGFFMGLPIGFLLYFIILVIKY